MPDPPPPQIAKSARLFLFQPVWLKNQKRLLNPPHLFHRFCVNWSSSNTDQEKNFLNLEDQSFEHVIFSQ